MTLFLVLLLAIVWGAVFVPAYFRSRKDLSPIASVGRFRRGMRALGGSYAAASGRWVVMPPAPRQTRLDASLHRRRRVFVSLLLSAAATLIFGVLPGLHPLLWWHLAFDAALCGFVVYLVKKKGSQDVLATDDWDVVPNAITTNHEGTYDDVIDEPVIETVISIPEPVEAVAMASATPAPSMEKATMSLVPGNVEEPEPQHEDVQLPLLKVGQL